MALAHAAADAWLVLVPTLLFLIARDYGNDYLFLGALANVVIAANGISAMATGVLADRYRPKVILAGFSLLTAAGALLAAFSPNAWLLAVSLAVFGLGAGIYHPVGLAAVTRHVARRSEALGIHAMAGEIGTAILPTLMISVALATNWRFAFGLAGVLSLALLPFIRQIPSRADTSGDGAGLQLGELWAGVRSPKLATVYITAVCREFGFAGTLVFLPTAVAVLGGLGEHRILGVSTTGLWTSFVLLCGALAAYAVGRAGEKSALERLLLLATVTPIPMLVLMGQTRGTALLAVLPFVGMSLSLSGPPVNGLIGKYLPEHLHGKGFAVLFGLGQTVSSLAGLLGGAVAGSLGLRWIFPIMAAFIALSVPLQLAVLWNRSRQAP